MLDHFGDVSNVTGANFAENTFKDPNDTSDNPVSLYVVFSTRKMSVGKKLTQKRPFVLNEQNGGDQV